MNARIVRSSMLMMLLVAVAVPASVRAQSADVATPVLSMQPVLTNLPSVGTGPALGAAMTPVGVTAKTGIAPVNVPMASMSAGEGVGANRAMMGAGIAAVLIGLIVGGDVGTLIAVGGAIFALVGLYRYMR